jgi:hydrophobic/amphiphilic exporter-1 (mainly G- bacteria), HAE1 family
VNAPVHDPPREGPAGLAIARPVTVLVGVLLVLLFGTLSVMRLPIQLAPDITIPMMTITTRWPGAAPTEVETEILEEQEDALKSVPGLVKMKSEAKPDEASIELEFEVGTSLEEALVRVSNRLTQVENYPEAARQPVVSTSTNAGPPLAVITIKSRSGGSVGQYRTWVEQTILPRFERIPGVASIRHLGGQDRQIHVDFDMTGLAARGISVAEVSRRIREELRDVSGGDLTLGKRRYLVRTDVAPQVPSQLERIVVGVGPTGTAVLLGDIATVHAGLRKPTGVAMSDNGNSMVLLLFREAGTNVLEVSEQVRDLVAELDATDFAAEGLAIDLVADQVGYIEGALALVRQNLLIGAGLAILVLLLFLRSIAASAVISIAIPVCVLGTALGMAAFGRTVNVVSLAGTAFAVGMVVDNSIVALESIDTFRRRGYSAARAAYLGVKEVWGAILASTVTTAAVFIPIIAWRDEVGELLRDVAVAVALAVIVSLFVSVLVIPSFSAKLLRPLPAGASDRRQLAGVGRWFIAAIGAQVRSLTRAWPRSLLVVLLAIGGSLGLARWLLPSMEYLPTGNRNLIFGILLPPPGYSPDELQGIAEHVQGRMAEHVGVEKGGLPSIERSFFVGDPNQVIYGTVADDPARIRELVPFVRAIGAEIPGAISFATQASLFGTTIGGGRAVEVEVSGPDLDALIDLGGRLFGAIGEALPGTQIRPIPSLDRGAPEIRAVPRRDEAAALAVSGAELGLMIDAYIDGAFVGELGPRGEPKLDVVLRALRPDGREIAAPEALAAAPAATPGGAVVPISSLAIIEERLGPTRIARIERRRAITLQVSPPDSIPLETAMDAIRNEVVAPLAEAGHIPPDIDIRLSGTAGKLEDAKQRFVVVLALAVLISFLLLAALFEDFIAPIAVLVTVPLAGAGGVLGLWLVDRYLGPQPLDLMTALGFVILVGVVVNNAILVVDGALTRLRDGTPLADAVPEAVESRVRPIFMSTATSLAGLLPMVVFSGSGAELYRGVGAIVLGGLAVSTVFTLYVVPSLFALLWRLRGE